MPRNPATCEKAARHTEKPEKGGGSPTHPLIEKEIGRHHPQHAGVKPRPRRELSIIRVTSGHLLEEARGLIKEYAASLDFDLCFQDLEKELAELPGDYSPPGGWLLLATFRQRAVGCVALRRVVGGICEMKRLYVKPAFRQKGIGRALVTTLIEDAQRAGYSRLLLDTVPSMKAAIRLYKSFGFKDVKPYRYNPIRGARFMEMNLERKGEGDTETHGMCKRTS